MSKIEKLIMACEDMTDVLTLDPKIETDDKSQMRLDLVEAAKLLKASDMVKLKDQTISVLEKLGIELPKTDKKEKKEDKGNDKKEEKESHKSDKKKRDKVLLRQKTKNKSNRHRRPDKGCKEACRQRNKYC